MMRIAAVALLAGCQSVLGFQTVAAPPPVTGHIAERYAANTAAGTPMLFDRNYGASELTLTVVADGTTTPIDVAPDGTFTFEASGVYRLHAITPSLDVEYQLSARQLDIVHHIAGRPDRVAPTQPTIVHVDAGSATGPAVIASTGVWTYASGVASSARFDYDWQMQAGAPGLLDATKNDLLYVGLLAPNAGATLDYYTIGQIASAAVTMTNGAPVNVSTVLAPVAQDLCARVVALRTQEQTRLAAVLPPGPTYSSTVTWALYAVPARSLGPAGAQRVALGTNVASGQDTDLQVQFGNPFPGSELVAELGAAAQFTLMLPGTTSGPVLSDATTTYVELDTSHTSCIANLASLTGTIGIPQQLAFDGAPLDTDGQMLAVAPGVDHVVTWASTSDVADDSSLELYELATAGSATTMTIRHTILSATPGSAVLGDDLLVPGHTYILRAYNNLGRPNFASGDVDTVAYPYAVAELYSSYFTVTR